MVWEELTVTKLYPNNTVRSERHNKDKPSRDLDNVLILRLESAFSKHFEREYDHVRGS